MSVRVLVVDDTEHVRVMLANMLALDGFDVVGTAADGAAVVALALDTDPDVVVMDLKMPGVDGIEATRRVRAARPDQPVVLYTAYLDAHIEREAREAGASVCVGKTEGLPVLEREIGRIALGLARRR